MGPGVCLVVVVVGVVVVVIREVVVVVGVVVVGGTYSLQVLPTQYWKHSHSNLSPRSVVKHVPFTQISYLFNKQDIIEAGD